MMDLVMYYRVRDDENEAGVSLADSNDELYKPDFNLPDVETRTKDNNKLFFVKIFFPIYSLANQVRKFLAHLSLVYVH
jgi:hypothetical protein